MSTNPNNDGEEATTTLPPEFALSGKIMLTAIVVLFFVVVLMICLHLYTRWYLLRLRRRNRRNRRTQIVFHHDHAAVSAAVGDGGLDEAVLNSLPVFVYDSRTEAAPLECAVCLSEFEESETGRVLPKCKHRFHIECVDMWFLSHSTCPLCRCDVESGPVPESSCNPNDDVAINVCGGPAEVNEIPGTSSGLCSECGSGSNRGLRQTASFGQRRKPMDITVPSRHESYGRSEAEPSPSFRSPMSRMLSFKRISSRERRNGGVSPSGNASCSSVAELDIERGREGAE